MGTVYIDRKEAALSHQGGTLQVHAGGALLQRIPLRLLNRVVIYGNASMTAATLGAMVASGVGVAMVTGRFEKQLIWVTGKPSNDAQRRLNQYKSSVTPAVKTAIARVILQRKLQAQERGLRHALRERNDCRHALFKGIETLKPLRVRLREENTLNLDTLRGIEGAAARAWFQSYRTLFSERLGFTGRYRRPPPDPVNAVLSLSYSLLYSEAIQAIHTAGLDASIGFLHEVSYGHEALASDLMEVFRPRIDLWVWALFRSGELSAESFSLSSGGCRLGKSGRARFYQQYESVAGRYRRGLRHAVRALVHYLMNDSLAR